MDAEYPMTFWRKALLVLMLLVFLGGLSVLLNDDAITTGKTQSSAAVLPAGIEQLLTGQEFSCLAVLQSAQSVCLYAGGTQGLFCIDPETLTVTTILDTDQMFQSVRALQVIEGQLWVGHEQGVSILQDDRVVRRIGQTEGLLDERVLDLLPVDAKTVYVATYSGVAILQEGTDVIWIQGVDSLPGESIKALFLDNRGGIWMGAYNARGGGVLVQQNDGSRQFLTSKEGLVHNSITSIAQLPDGRMAIGGGVYTEGGASLLRFEAGSWKIERNLRREDGLAGDKVRHIFVDHSDRIFYCSEYDGIAIFAGDQPARVLTTQDGLSDNEVKKIIQLDTGDYWLATRSGLTRIRSGFEIIP